MSEVVAEPPVEALPDDQVLALCELQMEKAQQEELGDLLAKNREGALRDMERERLDELMQVHRRGLARKAQALKVAVGRGLRPPLNGDGFGRKQIRDVRAPAVPPLGSVGNEDDRVFPS
ncbi:MAG: hypothetical protein HY784_05905 [Chloroflexi bacterium]|nr:hypothetical protein [Chloroflexota bacterium]